MNRAELADHRLAAPICDYCGLPVRSSAADDNEPRYCCLGCQLAAAITTGGSESDSRMSRTALQLGLAVFFSMNVMVFTMALWSWDTYAIATSANAAILKELLRLACLLFATPVVLILGTPLVTNVANQLRGRIITADCLLVVGVAAAFGYSVVSLMTKQEHIYFEVACMILVAVTLGRWLEAEGKHRAMKSLQSLRNLLPETALVVADDGALARQPLDLVSVGDVIRVLPGERMPLDGTIQSGQSYVDQQLVTGESRAECKSAGEEVFGGTANLDGRLDIRVDADAGSGVIQRLVESVREAASRTSRPQRLADRLATIFVPLVFIIAVLVFLAHWKTTDMHQALMSSMAVALIACPCALAIATPLAIWAALGNAVQHGIVFRTSDDLTALSEINHLCIDKTGTVTTDEPRLVRVSYLEGSEAAAQSVATQLSSQTLHPLASALAKQISGPLSENPLSENLLFESGMAIGPARTTPGKGVSAPLTTTATGHESTSTVAVLGSVEFCDDLGLVFSAALQGQTDRAITHGRSLVCVGWGGQVHGVFSFEETLRPNAVAVAESLKKLGLPTLLLTGDKSERTNRVASQLDLVAESQLLPDDKLDIIARLQADGHKVAMLGDGLNDAPALSAADVGIALGCGAEVTRDAADVCLMSSELTLLPWAVELSRRTRRTIRRNLIWAVAYNSVGIALAATGKLNPIFAALAMVLSSGFVIAESLRLSALPGPKLTEHNLAHSRTTAQIISSRADERVSVGSSST